MNKKMIMATLAASLVLAACGSNPTKKMSVKPDWVSNEPVQAGFAYGVGSAEIYKNEVTALQRAGNAAQVAMVQKLKVTVSGSFTQDVEETRQTGQATQLKQTVRNTIGSSIPTASFDNLEVQDSYVDNANRVVYRLVRLDRVKASSLLRRRISELDMQAIEKGNKTSASLGTLKQLQGLLPALTLIEQREKLADQAQLVDVNSRRPQKDDSLMGLEERIDALLNKLVITLEADNTAGTKIRSGLAQALTEMGLRISSQNPDLKLTLNAQLRSLEKSGRFIVFASGKVKIQEAGGRVLSEFSKEGKGVSGASAAQAEYKAVKNLAATLGKELAASLLQKID